MTKTWSIQEFKANVSEAVRNVHDEPQVITKHGKPVAALIPIEQLASVGTKPKPTVLELLRGNYTFTPPEGENWDDDWLERAELTLRPAPFEDEL
ncbi:hypothetical protein Dxin01_01647 [Deinococcus xinjiangensis]|uniref:Antitoxin n=1 Tax=Deinococcus xinjiangensis TaxID=457454 RepID=A0ABP9VF06_9DEIO